MFAKRGRFECVEPEIKSKNCSFSWKYKMRWFLFRSSKYEADHEDLYKRRNEYWRVGPWLSSYESCSGTHTLPLFIIVFAARSFNFHSFEAFASTAHETACFLLPSKQMNWFFFWRSFCTGVKRTMKSGGIMIAGFIVNENSDNSRSFFLFAGDLIFLACSHISQSSSEENVICHWKTR